MAIQARRPGFEEVRLPELAQGNELDEASPEENAGAQSDKPYKQTGARRRARASSRRIELAF